MHPCTCTVAHVMRAPRTGHARVTPCTCRPLTRIGASLLDDEGHLARPPRGSGARRDACWVAGTQPWLPGEPRPCRRLLWLPATLPDHGRAPNRRSAAVGEPQRDQRSSAGGQAGRRCVPAALRHRSRGGRRLGPGGWHCRGGRGVRRACAPRRTTGRCDACTGSVEAACSACEVCVPWCRSTSGFTDAARKRMQCAEIDACFRMAGNAHVYIRPTP